MHAAAPARRNESLDELTLRRAQRGDERAWRDLIERFQQPVHALIWRLLVGRARHRVEDLTQETFVRVLKALPGFDLAGTATLSTWILTIATRLALNELRKAEPVRLEGEIEGVERADVSTERRELGRAIAEAVAALPDAQRAAFVLREYHGLDYAEIASALELDINTVKSRLNRARAALRAKLGGTV
jgi:RNA polymerase sigma-70 factor (ECF subfamily)